MLIYEDPEWKQVIKELDDRFWETIELERAYHRVYSNKVKEKTVKNNT